MAKKDFNVAIMHGHSTEWKKVKKMIRDLDFTPRILKEEHASVVIFQHLRDIIWDEIHAVVIVLSGDDLMPDNGYRARQNVVFELGYCFGAFDSLDDSDTYTAAEAITVIAEEGVELFSDIDGLKRIIYKKNKLGMERKEIELALEQSFEKAKTYFKELKK